MKYDVVWDGTSLSELGFRVSSFSSDPPEPKLSIVSIPGGVDLDLTDSLTGHAAYENREMSVTLFYDGRGRDDTWQEAVNRLANMLSGKRADFELSWDPGYTYTGRASVTDVEYVPQYYCTATVEITAEPWKLRELHTTTVSAVGGVMVTCESGTRPVHPLISCDYPVTVNWEGSQFTVPAGRTYRLPLVTFGPGENELWLSVYSYRTAKWSDVAGSTWDDVAGIRWASIVVQDGEADPGEFPGNGSVTLQWEESYL